MLNVYIIYSNEEQKKSHISGRINQREYKSDFFYLREKFNKNLKNLDNSNDRI